MFPFLDSALARHSAVTLLILLIVAFFSSTSFAREEQLIIQQRLEQLYFDNEDKIGGEPVYATAYLHELYRKNEFQPLWTKSDNIDQLLWAIRNAVEDGLNPDDYHFKALENHARELAEEKQALKLADYDLLLSDAMILLGQHKRYGKVNPAKVEERHNLEVTSPRIVPIDIYLKAIVDGTVYEVLEQRAPAHQTYVLQKQALKKYRKIEEQGGWPQLPAGTLLKSGMRNNRVALLRQRLAATDNAEVLNAADINLMDAKLVEQVKNFQRRHHLEPDGVVGRATTEAMNISASQRINQIRVNLERTRWVIHDMPSSSIVIDIAGFTLQYYHDNALIWSTKVMVGKPFHQTPVFRSAISYMVLNPTWTIPPNIAKNETAVQAANSTDSLRRQRIRVFNSKGQEVDPDSIDWSQYRRRHVPYTLRQDPGAHNALGKIKFIFPNPYHVYLHDTPSKYLFDRARRAVSHGCIRVENPMHLAKLILQNDPGNPVTEARFQQFLKSGKTSTVQLKEPLPIFLMYLTTNVQDGMVLFKPDMYDRDKNIVKALNAPPTALEQPTRITEGTSAIDATETPGQLADNKASGTKEAAPANKTETTTSAAASLTNTSSAAKPVIGQNETAAQTGKNPI